MLFIFALWVAAAILIIPSIIPFIPEDLSFIKQIIVGLVTIIGAPFILITWAIEIILDLFLEEGWDDNDNYRQ